jgi:hypothetical protein
MQLEEIAYWYFRLNGFLTIPSFVLYPVQRGPQRTDADLLGVRFPHRGEFADTSGDKEFKLIAELHHRRH